MEHRKLTADVMDVVLGYCDVSTVLSVLYTCKDYHHVAIPHLYQEVTLKTAKQLEGFIHLSELARESRKYIYLDMGEIGVT